MLNNWLNKSVYVQLKSGRNYSGKIVEVDEAVNGVFITIIDKFGKRVVFMNSEIKVLEEENPESEIKRKEARKKK